MFCVEVLGGVYSGSVALFADAMDFAADSVNYALSLLIFSLVLVWRSRLALLKGISMVVFGVWVLWQAIFSMITGVLPQPLTMGSIAVLALLVNVGVAWLLYAYREGDANMRAVWLCSRNDAIGNMAVMLAAMGVWGMGRGWPDVVVAMVMASLALSSGWVVIRQARLELLVLKEKS
jgi:Co/Zn/Cd efflux system component